LPKINETAEYDTADMKVVAHVGASESERGVTFTNQQSGEPSVICDTTATTCFIESESKVEDTTRPTKIPSDLEVTMLSIIDFLGKPVLVGGAPITYSTGSTKNSNLLTQNMGALLTGNTYWANKIQGFNLVRGTWVIRAEANAQPFYQGKVLLHYLPCVTNFQSYDATWQNRYNITTSTTGQSALIAKYQHPHVEMDMRRTVATMRIPYITPLDYYQLESSVTPYDWGTLYVDSVVPLAVGLSAPDNSMYISIYAYMEDVELAAPLLPQTSCSERCDPVISLLLAGDIESNPGPGKGRMDREVQESKGPVSAGLSTLSSVASTLSSIPQLNVVAEPVSWAAAVASNVASMFGWSKPRILDNTEVMAAQQARYFGVADGNEVAYPLGLICDNKVELTDRYAITSEDEMSFRYLMSFPAYVQDLTWTRTSAINASLLSKSVTPLLWFVPDSTTHTHNITWGVGAPSWYLANFFEYWRGTVKLTLKFIKTQFHTGRLQVTFTPSLFETTAPGNVNSLPSIREIIDIREQEEITFTFPWLVPYKYLSLQKSAGAYTNQTSGWVDIVVLNELRAPETCSQSITIQVFWTPGEDFEYQVPTKPYGILGVPFSPQTSESERFPPELDLTVFGIEPNPGPEVQIVDKPIATVSVSSTNTDHSSKCIGEHFLSIKQLLSRMQTLMFGAAPSQTLVTIAPWSFGVLTLNSSAQVGTGEWLTDAMSIFGPMYAFYRGSMVYSWTTMGSSGSVTSTYCPGFFTRYNPTSTVPYLQNNAPSNTDTQQMAGVPTTTTGIYYQNTATSVHDYQNPTAIVRIPYQNRMPVSLLIPQDNLQSTAFAEPSQPCGAVAFQTGGGSTNPQVFERCCGDDFQFSFFLNAPPLALLYTA